MRNSLTGKTDTLPTTSGLAQWRQEARNKGSGDLKYRAPQNV